MRECPLPGAGRIPAPGSSWPQSTRIVHRKRRPTSKVDSITVLRARRGATGSKYLTFRGGVRRGLSILLVRSDAGHGGALFYADERSGLPAYCVSEKV